MVGSFVNVQRKEKLSLQTCFLMVHILDRILGMRIVKDNSVEVLYSIILKITVAYEHEDEDRYVVREVWPGDRNLFRKNEVELLKILDHRLCWPGPLLFLEELCEAFPGPSFDSQSPGLKEVATYILGASLFDEKPVQQLSSIVAAATYSLATVITGAEYPVRYHRILVAAHGLTKPDTRDRAGVQTPLRRNSPGHTPHEQVPQQGLQVYEESRS